MQTTIPPAAVETVAISVTVILSIASGIVGALVTVIGILWRDRAARDVQHKEDLAAANAAREKAEAGRLDDLRAANSVVRETQEKTLPVLERVALELRIMNERRSRKMKGDDSDPPRTSSLPDDLEDTVTRIRRAEEEAAREREKLAERLSKGGNSNGSTSR